VLPKVELEDFREMRSENNDEGPECPRVKLLKNLCQRRVLERRMDMSKTLQKMDTNNIPLSDKALKKRHQRIHLRLAAQDVHNRV